ncbi:hypothetical protein TRP8649_02348 [Pelagimonas phthalicica]|uniref:N-acetyltransferase domain-containing protein n=1 Tax=Pelagimonas phthalicica TaxID=1037362 RepID=A0A238JE34_9RHOB|nr:GNAT family N-acetyltransferase [Pelagimonas phthalicica]TDS91184.1 RimJ/RimL family protein N-acetyltransferase [Pelagimonas phthalicica]SMX28232.1 hypothetical protein TRP8649_02348 [Pelagimonas phthalicica]
MGRFELRPLSAADADWIAREVANPNVHRWLTSVPCPYGLSNAKWFIDRFAENPRFRVIAAEHPLGVISIESASSFDPDRPNVPELGYWLAEHAWGRGVMTAAGHRMVDWFFGSGLGEVIGSGWIRGNSRSARVLGKLGFTPTGETLMRHAYFHGKEVPIERVALSKDQWQIAKPA